jgi:hypothetical protein
LKGDLIFADEEVVPRGHPVTSQDFVKFWGNFFAFVMLEMIGNSQEFKTFESN